MFFLFKFHRCSLLLSEFAVSRRALEIVAIRSQERVLGLGEAAVWFQSSRQTVQAWPPLLPAPAEIFHNKQIRDQRAGMSNFQQAQQEGLCLRFPENLGLHREISYENAAAMLLRAVSMSQNVPFAWGFVDKPVGWLRNFHSWGMLDN